jgi:outer membrane protein
VTWLLLLFTAAWARAAAPETFLHDLDAFKEKSPAIRTQAERLNAASYRALSRSLHWTPDINLSVSRNERRAQANVSSQDLSFRESTDLLAVGGRVNLFRGFSDAKSATAAKLQKESAGLLVENENLNVELEGARLIFGSLYLKEALDAQREQLRLREAALRIGRERYKQGKIPLQEVTTVEVDLADLRTKLRQAELQVEENLVGLRNLFVDSFQTTAWPFAKGQQLNLGDLASPLLRSLRLEEEAAKKNEQAARLLHLPSIDLNLNYQLYPLRSLDNKELLGSLTFTLPIWNRFETVAATAEARAAAAQAAAQAATRGREEGLRRDYLKKKVALSVANVEEAEKNLQRSEGLYQTMLRSFQLGRISANDLQIEQERRIRVLLSLAESRQSFHESLMEACALWGNLARNCFL